MKLKDKTGDTRWKAGERKGLENIASINPRTSPGIPESRSFYKGPNFVFENFKSPDIKWWMDGCKQIFTSSWIYWGDNIVNLPSYIEVTSMNLPTFTVPAVWSSPWLTQVKASSELIGSAGQSWLNGLASVLSVEILYVETEMIKSIISI